MYSFHNFEPVSCFVSHSNILTIASWPAYRFHRQVRWFGSQIFSSIFQFVVIHTVKGFIVVSKVYAFLEYLCFFYDPTDVGNLISGFFAFSKSSLYILKFLVHVLLKPSLKNFDHCLLACDEHNCMVVWMFKHSNGCLNILWHCLSLELEVKLIFSSPVAPAEFSKLLAYWVQHLNSIIF